MDILQQFISAAVFGVKAFADGLKNKWIHMYIFKYASFFPLKKFSNWKSWR